MIKCASILVLRILHPNDEVIDTEQLPRHGAYEQAVFVALFKHHDHFGFFDAGIRSWKRRMPVRSSNQGPT
jgi:hypothetical protein